MFKCEVIKEFTLEDYKQLKNIVRADKEEKGKLFVGDTFECDEKMVDYLTGNNLSKITVVNVLGEIAEKKEEPAKKTTKKTTTKRKTTKK